VWVAGPGVGDFEVPGADLHSRVHDVHPGQQGEQEEEDHGEQLPRQLGRRSTSLFKSENF